MLEAINILGFLALVGIMLFGVLVQLPFDVVADIATVFALIMLAVSTALWLLYLASASAAVRRRKKSHHFVRLLAIMLLILVVAPVGAGANTPQREDSSFMRPQSSSPTDPATSNGQRNTVDVMPILNRLATYKAEFCDKLAGKEQHQCRIDYDNLAIQIRTIEASAMTAIEALRRGDYANASYALERKYDDDLDKYWIDFVTVFEKYYKE